MIGTEYIKELAVISQGLLPAWVEQTTVGDIPLSLLSGVSVDDAVVAMVAVSARRSAPPFSTIISIETPDITATEYTIEINGVTYVYDAAIEAPSDLQEMLESIASGLAAATSKAVSVSESGALEVVSQTPLIVSATTSGGTASISFVEDASLVEFVVWGLADQAGSAIPWLKINNASLQATGEGFIERFEVSGVSRLFVGVSGATGPSAENDGYAGTHQPKIWIGPGRLSR